MLLHYEVHFSAFSHILYCTFSSIKYRLPGILFHIIVEDGFFSPAEVDEGQADELSDVGGDGMLGAVVLVVALAGEEQVGPSNSGGRRAVAFWGSGG